MNYNQNNLEHFGKKGMRWGHRNAQQSFGRRPTAQQQRRAGKIRFARNLAIGAGVGIAGGLLVGKIVGSKIPLSKMNGIVKTKDYANKTKALLGNLTKTPQLVNLIKSQGPTSKERKK